MAHCHLVSNAFSALTMPSVLWCCWLGSRKGIRPVKNWVVRCWRGYLSGARCRLASAQLMPLPLTVSCFSKIQIDFAFLVLAHPGSPGKRAVKRVCVCSNFNSLGVVLVLNVQSSAILLVSADIATDELLLHASSLLPVKSCCFKTYRLLQM